MTASAATTGAGGDAADGGVDGIDSSTTAQPASHHPARHDSLARAAYEAGMSVSLVARQGLRFAR
ncbi:hypothetical protein [Polaromonas sp. JS666]|uniref:hypothetical protein n=1 Tax=Polaromonas sp. (strain JS666 / ATCC BAA-500) TaxID=296591 RepID=UPI000046469F|nr:hypothetical protein [Polaromonas sp. JS666]